MILEKIIIDNIRTHKHFEFEPNKTGTTAIVGENGAGKSTIVDCFSWCLFGIKQKSLKNRDFIREGTDLKKDKVQVQVFLQVGNKHYKITRSIINKQGLIECSVYIKKNNEYILECGPSITHSEEYIRTLLNYDEKGFLASVFIQQKQVDQIILATPKEREEVIEKLIGVASITEAMNMTKEESKTLQKAAQINQPKSIEEEKEKLENQKKLVKEMLEKKEKLLKNLKEDKKIFKTVSNDYLKEKEKQEKTNILENNLIIIKNDFKTLNEQLNQNLNLYKKLSVDKGKKILPLEELEKDKKDKESKLNELNTLLQNLNYEKKSLDNLFSKKIKQETFENKKAIDQSIYDIQNEMKALEISILQGNEKSKYLKKFIKELKDGKATCLMCNSPIEDTQKELKIREDELDSLENSIKNSKINLENKKNESTKLLENIIEINSQIDIYNQQEENKERYNNLFKEISSIEIEIKVKEKELKVIQENYDVIKLINHNVEYLNTVKENIKSIQDSLKEKSVIKNNLVEEINNIKALSKKDFKLLENKYNSLINSINELEKDILKFENSIGIEKQKGKEFYNNYKNCVEAHKKYNKLSSKITLLNYSVKALEEFKELRVIKSIPALANIASEILKKFTDGEYVEIRFSKSFEITVINKFGTERKVHVLSGGELSTVAIAVRIAIALFLHEGNQRLLILDEILTAMSEERSQLILETITSLTQAQIIFIAHSTMVNNFADKIIKI